MIPDKYIGRRLDGRYEIQQMVGEGGMANVYRAWDLKEDRQVAVKILRDEFYNNEDLVRRFINESRAISVLQDPHIVKVYDVSVDNRVHYIVMEFLEGITLKEYIEQRGGPLTYREAVDFTNQILKSLQHAHDKGIVHRDIKPQNIMLTTDGSLKIMDFGIARLSRSESYTMTDQAIGSVHYISPEQAQGEDTDARADIYSTGIMLYEMLTGTLPFEDENAVAIAMKQITDAPVPPRQVNPAIPPGLEEITLRAMAKEPARRYQNALEMLRDLDEFKYDPNVRFEYDDLPLAEGPKTRMVNPMRKPANNPKAAAQAPVTGNGKPRRRKKKLTFGQLVMPVSAAVAGLMAIVCLIACLTIFNRSGNFLFNRYDDIDLPNFVGMQYDEVLNQKRTTYKYLNITKTDEFNPDVPAGVVISQTPSGNKRVQENLRIHLVVSMGVEMVSVPDVRGMTRAQATQALLDVGLRPYIVAINSTERAPGQVISTTPEVGAQVANDGQNNTVTVYIAGNYGSFEREVPSLVGLKLEDAQTLLTERGLIVGLVTKKNDSSPAGTVLEQNPPEGTTLRAGMQVSLVISEGPASASSAPAASSNNQVSVPDVSGMTPDAAAASLSAAGLVPQRQDQANAAPSGQVYGTNPGSGTKVAKGSTVIYYVSTGSGGGGGGGSSSEASSSSDGGTPPTP